MTSDLTIGKPRRVQRKRTKGFKLPPNTVCVTRGTPWGNPFSAKDVGNEVAVERFVLHLQGYFGFAGTKALKEWLAPLRGKNLACYCKLSDACHADVLLDLASEYSAESENG